MLLIVLPAWGQTAVPRGAESYQLGAEDKLRIRVPVLRNFSGEPQPEAAVLNDEFIVGPGGDLSLPLIGAVPAAGKTTEAVANEIADRLRTVLGSERPPRISVEVTGFRPFYLVGAVSHPGEYAYRPGMTVLQAVSIGGGLFRPSQTDAVQGSAGPQQADLRFLLLQSDRLIVRRARLQAELDNASEVNFPPELVQRASTPEVAEMLKQEGAAFASYRDGEKSAIASRNRLKEQLTNEIRSLQEKIGSIDQELVLVKKELTKVTELAARGLAIAPQQLSIQENLMGLQRQRLDLDTAVLRAREEIDKTDQGLVDLQNQTQRDVLGKLDENAAKFSEVSAKIAAITGVLRHDEAAMLELAASRTGEAAIIYSIVRYDHFSSHETVVTEMTLVEPGDTIRVGQHPASSATSPLDVTSSNPATSSPLPEAAKPETKSQLQMPGRASLVASDRATSLITGLATQPSTGGTGVILHNTGNE
jgi:protein involved in polysaccharide export with SLBB domain